MDNNSKIKLSINYLEKKAEIYLDNNISNEEIKSNISRKLNISDKDKDTIFVKFFDIKFEKLSPQETFEIRFDLLKNEKIMNSKLISQNQNVEKEIEALHNDILSFKKEMNSINEQYDKAIKEIQDKYESLKTKINSQNNENFKLLKNEVDKIINKNKKGNANIDNNIDVDEDAEIFDLISQIQNEIKEIKNNKDNIFDLNKNLNNNKDKDKENNININKDINLDRNKIENEQKDNQDLYETFDDFKKKYSFDGLGIKEEEIKRIFYNKKNDFFETMSEIIKRSYN